MNNNHIRAFVRKIIQEVKEKQTDKKEQKLPKSSGKLVDMKKELTALEQMKEELQLAKFAEKTASTEVEFANLQKFAKELDRLKQSKGTLESSIDSKINELKAKIEAEKNKIREMIGLTPDKGQKKIEEPQNSGEDNIDTSSEEDLKEYVLPSKGMTKSEKSSVVKKARAGKDIGKKGKNFDKVAKSAGGGKKGEKIAAAQMWKQQAKK